MHHKRGLKLQFCSYFVVVLGHLVSVVVLVLVVMQSTEKTRRRLFLHLPNSATEDRFTIALSGAAELLCNVTTTKKNLRNLEILKCFCILSEF